MPSITSMSRWWSTSFSIATGRIRSSTNARTVVLEQPLLVAQGEIHGARVYGRWV